VRWIRINENPQHPLIALFESRLVARARALELGAPWVAMAYACGYILTDGWNFRDANGLVSTFCPVPPDALRTMEQLIIALQREPMAGRTWLNASGLPCVRFRVLRNCPIRSLKTCAAARCCVSVTWPRPARKTTG